MCAELLSTSESMLLIKQYNICFMLEFFGFLAAECMGIVSGVLQ